MSFTRQDVEELAALVGDSKYAAIFEHLRFHTSEIGVVPNVGTCHLCLNPTPRPTEPGEWEYKQYPTWESSKWQRVKVVRPHEDEMESEYDLHMYLRDAKGRAATEPSWWPDNSLWRQYKKGTK